MQFLRLPFSVAAPASSLIARPTLRSRLRPLLKSAALCRRHWSSNSAATASPPSFRDDVRALYRQEYIDFYDKHIAGRPRYNPFDGAGNGASWEYPCPADFQPRSPVASNVACRDFLLPRNAAGSILLRVYNSTETNSYSPVILYLPSRGTSPTLTSNEHHVISYIAQLTAATVVSVGYRISQPFPLSLHDALAALDWVRRRIPTVDLETYSDGFSGRLIAVLGTGLGGSLAISMGITEGRESGIIAVGAWAPVVDWAFDPLPGIPESPLSSLPRSPNALQQHISDFQSLGFGDDSLTFCSLAKLPASKLSELGLTQPMLSTFKSVSDNPFLSTKDLKHLRSRYFATAEDFTDPFASPMYWFASSGVNIWPDLLSQIEDTKLANPDNIPRWIDELPPALFERGARRTRSYPSLDLVGKLTVPSMRIVSADSDILHEQTSEFVKAARNSLFPRKPRTVQDLALEEARELQRRFNNDTVPEPNGFVVNTVPLLDTQLPGAQQEEPRQNTGELVGDHLSPKGAAPDPGDSLYIQHEVKQKAAHCFITAAGEINDGIEEAERMALWLDAIFQHEPIRTSRWKETMEQRKADIKARSR
ncbi:hypothetical protein DRE_04319 [Drechslerella stenobrocha 248]|uniref:Alpha/beta hydrolase fold-3 domain-containing protein n=1 Tax=Drechslerella stenobrocha 248 TaxID=1043628 RepID=W7HQD9_9PEZI|nr:hypothetical protein DRE_04319 [Drechslerella stenobrocha 248]